MDTQRRQQLIDKFPAMNQPPVPSRSNRVGKSAWPANDILRATLDGEEIVAKTFTRGSDYAELFDPSRSPEMYAVATKAHREFRLAMARGDIEFITARPYGGAPFDPDDPNDMATLVHYVGDWRAFVCRSQPDNFSALLYVATNLGADQSCTINITSDCHGEATMLPLLFGTVLLIFGCCPSCLVAAGRLADDGFIVSEMEARAQVGLPPRP